MLPRRGVPSAATGLLARERGSVRAEGVGEIRSTVARMSGEAPPLLPIYKGLARGSAAPFRAGVEQALGRAGGFCLPIQSSQVVGTAIAIHVHPLGNGLPLGL